MRRYNPRERIQIYLPLHSFLGLITNEIEDAIEQGKYDDIILDSPDSRNQKKIKKKIPNPIERLVILALTAKNMAEQEKTDDRNILFSLSRIPFFLFPNFNEENVDLYSQTDIEEIMEFINEFTNILPQHSPRYDTRLLIVLKLEYYVNSFLYFAKSMSEKRFPFGSGYYDFLGFLIHEFYTILKPVVDEHQREVQNLVTLFSSYFNYTTIIYMFEHFPEQSAELVFILNNVKKLKFSKNEKELLEEVLEETILINREDKKILMKKILS